MARVIRLTEKDIESLVGRIIKEEGSVSGADVRKDMISKAKEMSSGLSPAEREVFMKAVGMLGKFFQQPGNQAVGKVNNLLGRLFNELANVKGEPEQQQESVNESLPRRERERHATQFARSSFEPYERESQLMDIFGPYKQDVPPNVISYMRKNPALIIKRLEQVYGRDKILRYLGIEE
jgi:hypothetical protein